MSTDSEMQRALEADGEKLRQLTGEDHGPWRDLPRHFTDWQFQRVDAEGEPFNLEVVVHYDIEPYVPARTYGPPEDCYPAEGGCVTDMVALKAGTNEIVDLTQEEQVEARDWIERNHDHNEDRYGDPDAAYDQWRDDEMMGLHEPGHGWDD